MDDLTLPLDAFVRSVGVNRNSPHSLFLGAGASVSSGIPSAWTCIWEWKRSIFLTNNPGLEDQFGELSLPAVRQRIQRWLDEKRCYPPEDSSDEYAVYIEKCFPISENRRRYFQEKTLAAKPHIGYQLLCLLAEAEIVRSVWTTNFDSLTARAAANFQLVPIEVGIDCQQRILRQPCKGEFLCVSMHGDYRYDALKNTTEELQKQEAALRKSLAERLEDTALIVCGYSGRDASVMEALTNALSQPGTGTFYWCGYSSEPAPAVQKVITTARANCRTAFFVPAQGFDDLMTRLARHCLSNDKLVRVAKSLAAADNLKSQWEPFRLDPLPIKGLIKSNAFEVEVPSEVFQFDLKEWPAEKTWQWIRELTEGTQLIAVPFRAKVLALGLLDEIKKVFGENIQGSIERSPIGDIDMRYEDGAVISLLRRALLCAMAIRADVETDADDRLWEKKHYETKNEGGQECRVHRAVIVSLRRVGGRMMLILKPSLMIRDTSGNRASRDISNKVKLDVLGWQHNKEFNQAVELWRQRLLPDRPVTTIEYPNACGSTFRFGVRRAPVFAGIGGNAGQREIHLADTFRPLIKQKGVELSEPNLRFASKGGTGYVTDPHPIRGLVTNRPYDYRLSHQGFSPGMSIGVICPRTESRFLEPYLHKCETRQQPQRSEEDYLLDYPGFTSAFGVSITLPEPETDGWAVCPEIDVSLGEREGCLELARMLTQAISSLEATCKPNVILVFMPTRWRKWTRFAAEDEQFDLHDFVKAYCVQRGIATQFLDQDTLDHLQQCRIWWWLLLALYTKGMRTPWVLDGLDADTAYVGLGFGIDQKAEVGQHVVLGCSHLYNAQGEGLQYRLSKIENPLIVRGNPFMSHDDARRVGETIRQLFFDAHTRLPRRVVIHKLTPFRRDEREGLQEGLSGVDELDMLEINVKSALRYVASVAKDKGRFDEDNYPVRRGTLVQLDDYAALLWVHGVTDAVKPKLKYYQGKRRIPAPVVIRRHAGRAELSVLAQEILGLSKMDWNSADMYSRLPATVYSSKQIAKIGNLLRGAGPMSYDYRLFI